MKQWEGLTTMPNTQQCKNFINTIAPIIQREAFARGYCTPSAIIAQACLESRYGFSGLAQYHNYHGLKCGSSWRGASVNMATKEEFTPGIKSNTRDNFRVFANMTEGVKGYFDFINTNRYKNLKTAKTAAQYLQLIKNDGYATSSTYVNDVLNCCRKWDLFRFDIEPENKSNNINDEIVAQRVINGEFGNGEERKARLIAAGYNPETIQKIVNKLLNKK